jgi:hypothetical protein
VLVEPVVALSTVNLVHVLSGLEAGDHLIVEGLGSIVDGAPVRTIQNDAPSAGNSKP